MAFAAVPQRITVANAQPQIVLTRGLLVDQAQGCGSGRLRLRQTMRFEHSGDGRDP